MTNDNVLLPQMTNSELPPTFGSLLLTDVDRGQELYEEPHYESRVAHSFLPAPLSGMFGGGKWVGGGGW